MKKRCSRCRLEKDIAEFGKNRSRKDGFHPQCKSCKSVENRATYLKRTCVPELSLNSVHELSLNSVPETKVTPKHVLKVTKQEIDDFWNSDDFK